MLRLPFDLIESVEVDALRSENQALRVENQILKDEIARLKGLPPRPPSKPHKSSGMEQATDPSGPTNRKGRRRTRVAKRDSNRITREMIVKAEAPAGPFSAESPSGNSERPGSGAVQGRSATRF